MKKNFLGLMLVFTSIIGLMQINYSFFNSQDTAVKLKDYNLNATFYNLSNITSIKSPEKITAKKAQSVTYTEVQSVLTQNVTNAVLAEVPFATANDYSFRFYANSQEDPYQNLNLVNNTGSVYVIIAASPSSTTLVGATNPIQVILPAASSQQINLQTLTAITAPAEISATDLASVTYNELQSSLKNNILNAVEALAPESTENDFLYFLAKDNQGTLFQNLNLEAHSNIIYIKVISNSKSNILVNQSNYIAVALPIYKFSLSSIVTINNICNEITTNNPKSVTKEELISHLLTSIKNIITARAPLAKYQLDYDFDIYFDSNKEPYQNINIYERTSIVYVNIFALPNSKYIENDTSALPIVFLEKRTDIKNIDLITTNKSEFAGIDPSVVSLLDLHNILNQNILDSIRKINNHATIIDYDFQIYTKKENHFRKDDSINLYNNTTLYIKINANDNSTIISGNTNLITVPLPYFSLNINFLTYNWWWIMSLFSIFFILTILIIKKIVINK